MTERTVQENPPMSTASRDWVRVVSLALSVLGLVVAGYLSYAEVLGGVDTMVCPSEGGKILGLPIDCGTVNLSRYASVGPFPVALMGLGGYVMILLLLTFWDRVPLLQAYGHLMFFGLTLFGFAFSMYLTWAEITQIKAFCTWCIASALLMALLFGLALIRLVQKFQEIQLEEG